MSNYLDNLVLRNQQAIEVVRPRLPSIFEPPAAMPFTSSTLHRVVQLESHQLPDDSTVPTALNEPGDMTTQREAEPLMLIKLENQARMPDPPAARTIPAWRGV